MLVEVQRSLFQYIPQQEPTSSSYLCSSKKVRFPKNVTNEAIMKKCYAKLKWADDENNHRNLTPLSEACLNESFEQKTRRNIEIKRGEL